MRHYTESGRLYLDAFNLFGMTNYFYFSFAVEAEIGVGSEFRLILGTLMARPPRVERDCRNTNVAYREIKSVGFCGEIR